MGPSVESDRSNQFVPASSSCPYATADRRRRPLARYTLALGSNNGSPEDSMPSTRGIGSKMVWR
jgi:hypothetical protein